MKKYAVVGVEGLNKILLQGINKVSPLKKSPFGSVEEVKAWLVAD